MTRSHLVRNGREPAREAVARAVSERLSEVDVPSGTCARGRWTFTADLTEIYREVLGRNPDSGGIATYTEAHANGTSTAEIRQMIAQSPEARGYLNGLYRQIFDRDIDTGGYATYSGQMANGTSCRTRR